MLEEEERWRQRGLVWAWIDPVPGWVSAVGWDIVILPDPEREATRRIRFALLGGGQITVVEQFERIDKTRRVASSTASFVAALRSVPRRRQAMACAASTATSTWGLRDVGVR